MRDGLSSQGRKCKFATELAATLPQRFHVVASRAVSLDRAAVAVQGEFVGTLEAVRRHARTVADSIAARFNVPACCDVTDAHGDPVCSVSALGGGR